MSVPPVRARPRPATDAAPSTGRYTPGKALPPVRPSAAIRDMYERRMAHEITALHDSIVFAIKASWRRSTPATVAMDASPERQLRDLMRKRGRLWRGKYRAFAEKLAAEVTRKSQKHVDRAMAQILKDNGVSIKFRMTRPMSAVVEASLSEQVALITNVADKHLVQVEGAIMRAIQNGQDLEQLTTELQGTLGIARRRAVNIALDQTAKTTATMAKQRALDLGCDEAEWLHSAGGVKPRQDHVAFSRKRYKLATGALISGEYIHPGQKPFCRCVSRPVLPSLAELRK